MKYIEALMAAGEALVACREGQVSIVLFCLMLAIYFWCENTTP